MEFLLIGVTVVSLGLAIVMSVVAWKLLRTERQRSAARVEALDALAEEGYDPHFGARPLKRTVQRRLQNPLAMKILSSEIKPGQTVEVDAKRGELVFTAVPAREPVAV